MKAKMHPESVSAHAMNDWLARLRAEADDEPGGDRALDGWADPGGADPGWADPTWADPGWTSADWPSGEPKGEGEILRQLAAEAPPASRQAAGTESAAHSGTTMRAVIGDQLRIPMVWCEMGQCISYHSHPGALGQADIRARALSDGWRLDRLGRLTCPRCQQSSPWFWPAYPVTAWDKEAAAATIAVLTTRHPRNGDSRDTGVAHAAIVTPVWSPAGAPPGHWRRGRHRKQQY